MPKAIIAPSILASDFAKLGCECHRMHDAGADWFHIDVMDGHFVPNISLGPPIITSLRKEFPKDGKVLFDCHMMVSDPEKWIPDVAKAGGDSYTFHYEATQDPVSVVNKIKEHGMRASCAVKPGTPIESLYDIADKLDMVLVMTVEPGFGGQKFMADMMPKVEQLRAKFPHLNIQVDGGLGRETVPAAADAGANVIVAGTSCFTATSPDELIEFMKATVNDGLKAKNVYSE